MAAAQVLGTCAVRRAGSSPALRTKYGMMISKGIKVPRKKKKLGLGDTVRINKNNRWSDEFTGKIGYIKAITGKTIFLVSVDGEEDLHPMLEDSLELIEKKNWDEEKV